MDALLPDLHAERAKYGATLTDDECVALLNAVAWKHRADGWGLTGKNFGGGVGRRYDGELCSHDTLLNRETNLIYDVLDSAGAASTPVLATGVPHTQSNRPWVAPIPPQGVNEPTPDPEPPKPQPPAPVSCQCQDQIAALTHALTAVVAELAQYREEQVGGLSALALAIQDVRQTQDRPEAIQLGHRLLGHINGVLRPPQENR